MAIVPLVTGVPNWYDGGLFHAGIQNFVLLGLNQASFWSSETQIVNVAWTPDIELQFYLLVPLVSSFAPALLVTCTARHCSAGWAFSRFPAL